MRTMMKIIIVLFSVITIVLCEIVVEDKAENVQNGGEIISEKVITETKSVSSGGSAAVSDVGATQKLKDEKILDDMYNKGTLIKEKLKNEEALKASSVKLNAAEHTMVSAAAEKMRHHMTGDEQLKKQAGTVLNTQIHHQTAAGHEIPDHHLLANHHLESMKHNPINLHGSKIMSEQNKQIQEVSEIQTTKIIREKVTNHQVSSQVGHDHMIAAGVHYPVVISREITNPHTQKLMQHNHADHMIARPVVHNKVPIIVQAPHEETLHQLAAIRLINQQLKEAMIQNQQAALVGLEIQRQLEMKDKQQKLLASHHRVPHVVHIHEHVPTSGHALPILKPRDHLVNHGQHHHVTVLGDSHHSSVNKHELSKMRHLANEMQSPHIAHTKVVHNTKEVQNAGMATSVAKESLVRTSAVGKVLNEETAKKHGVEVGTAVAKVNTEDTNKIHELVEGKAIASDLLASKRSGLETVKETVKGSLGEDMVADESIKKMEAVKKTGGMIPVSTMIKGLDTLADKSLTEMDSLKNIEGTVIKKEDVIAEKSLKDLSQVKKSEDIASESTLWKSANIAKEGALKPKVSAKKTEVTAVDGAAMIAANTAVSQETAITVKKTEEAQDTMLNAANVDAATSLKDDSRKIALSEDANLKSSKVIDATENTESVRLGNAALNVAIVADKNLKKKEVEKRTETATAGSTVNKEASISGDKLIKELSAIEKGGDEAVANKVAETALKINFFKEADSALANDSVLKEVEADKSVKEADVSKTEVSDAEGANIGLKATNIDTEKAFKLASTSKKIGSDVAQEGALKASNIIADGLIEVAENNKPTKGVVAQDAALKTTEIFADSASNVADIVKKVENTVAKDAGMEIANIATDKAVKDAGDVKKAESAVAQDKKLKATNTVADSVLNVASTGKQTENVNVQDAANAVISSSIKLEDVKKTESAEGNSIVKETDVVAEKPINQVGSVTDDSMVKTASKVVGNVMKQADNSKSAEGLAVKSEEVVANKAENTVKELEAVKKSVETNVGVTMVSNPEISDLKKNIEKKKLDNDKQSLQQSLNVDAAAAAAIDKRETMPAQVVTSDTPKIPAASGNAVACSAEIIDANEKIATVNKKIQDVGIANSDSLIDDALVKQERQKIFADQSQQKDGAVENSGDTAKNSKATQQLKVDNETLQKVVDKNVAIVESVSGKDLINEGVNEQLKNAKDPEVMGVNVKNIKKKADEKKIDILQKSMVDERMAPPVATGGDTSKNGPIFTLREGSP